MLFEWSPLSEAPFDVFMRDDLDEEAQQWLDGDVSDKRLRKLVVPDMGLSKEFSIFARIQFGVTSGKRKSETNRLNDTFFRLRDHGMGWRQAYEHMSLSESDCMLVDRKRKQVFYVINILT